MSINIYDIDAHFYGHQEAIEYLRGMVWHEIETTEQNTPLHSEHIESFEGVDLYYCFGSDSYFFSEG